MFAIEALNYSGFDERTNLGNIQIPLLCLVGENNENVPPAVMERMTSRIPGARYVCLPGFGHMPYFEAPPVFVGAIFRFMRKVLWNIVE